MGSLAHQDLRVQWVHKVVVVHQVKQADQDSRVLVENEVQRELPDVTVHQEIQAHQDQEDRVVLQVRSLQLERGE